MKLKTALSLLALACAGVSTSAMAQSTGTLQIKGNISPVSCTPTLTGAVSSGTINMPDAQISDYTAAGNTGGAVDFTFNWTGCTVLTGIDNVWVHFDGANVETAGTYAGSIKPTTGSNNMRFQLLDGGTGGPVIKAGGTAGTGGPGADQGTSAAFSGANPNRSATKTYGIRYISTQALSIADAGQVLSDVTYNVKYH